MSPWVQRALLPAGLFAVLAFAAACSSGKGAPQGGGGAASTARQGGEIEAVKLLEAWVNAGAPEKEPFTFTAKDGKKYKATFEKDILRLFTTPNIWADNTQACIECHSAVSEKSVHEMGLGSYKDIMTGADSISDPQNPAKLFEPGKFDGSTLQKRLRNNRMPPGMPFDITEANRDGPEVPTKSGGKVKAVDLIGAWVDAGAKENEPFKFKGTDGKEYTGTFKDDVLPLFTTPNTWAPNTQACIECHSAVSEKSVHEMGLGSYKDIMTGADAVSNPKDPDKIIIPGDWEKSPLRARLRNNRMPPGMPFDITEANRDGPVVRAGVPAE